MKNILKIAIASLALTSCQKVVDIDLNDANKKIVIEAALSNGEQPFLVNITKTTDFYGKEQQVTVDNAEVTITNDDGTTFIVPSAEKGLYALTTFKGVPGHTYTLKVKANGTEYTAQSTMPYDVQIESLTYEYKEADLGEAGYQLKYTFSDPADQDNNYLMMLTVNDTLLENPADLLLFNDKKALGNVMGNDFYKRFKKGDKIQVELRGMDNEVYMYLSTLREILTNQNGPAPANPVSNIKGGALGYFGAFNTSKKQITIQ